MLETYSILERDHRVQIYLSLSAKFVLFPDFSSLKGCMIHPKSVHHLGYMILVAGFAMLCFDWPEIVLIFLETKRSLLSF